MKPLTLAKKYLDVFYNTGDFESLYDIFDPDLKFSGPLYLFNSSEDYINSLKKAPPKECAYRIIEEFENENSASILYEFTKKNKTTVMSQSFWLVGEKISEIRLIFNVADLES